MSVNEYIDGGMKLTDVDMFLNSLKCGWVNTKCNDCWKIVYSHILNRNEGHFYFNLLINTPQIKSICKKHKLSQRLISWNNVNLCDSNGESHSVLWNDSEIKQENQTSYRK